MGPGYVAGVSRLPLHKLEVFCVGPPRAVGLPMKIELEGVQYYRGLGDIAMLAWLAEGSQAGPDPITFHRTNNLDLMHLLGLSVDSAPGGIVLDEVFQVEVADG